MSLVSVSCVILALKSRFLEYLSYCLVVESQSETNKSQQAYFPQHTAVKVCRKRPKVVMSSGPFKSQLTSETQNSAMQDNQSRELSLMKERHYPLLLEPVLRPVIPGVGTTPASACEGNAQPAQFHSNL